MLAAAPFRCSTTLISCEYEHLESRNSTFTNDCFALYNTFILASPASEGSFSTATRKYVSSKTPALRKSVVWRRARDAKSDDISHSHQSAPAGITGALFFCLARSAIRRITIRKNNPRAPQFSDEMLPHLGGGGPGTPPPAGAPSTEGKRLSDQMLSGLKWGGLTGTERPNPRGGAPDATILRASN